MAKRRAVDLHENQSHAVGEIFHQGGLTISGRRDEQQQTHEVRALSIAGRTNLLGKVIADNRQIHFIHQLVPHKRRQNARLKFMQAQRLFFRFDERLF